MKSNTLLFAFCFLVQNIVLISGTGQECGGVLMGDYGNFRYPIIGPSSAEGSCIWLIQGFGVSEIRFTLNELESSGNNGASVILYPQTEPVDSTLSAITLSASAVGTTTRLPGSAVVVIFPKPNNTAIFSFTWDSAIEDVSVTDAITVTSYVNTAEGHLKWRPRRRQERLIWVMDAEEPGLEFGWETSVDSFGCNSLIPCTCLNFRAFEIDNEGYLVELERNCDMSSNGTISSFSSPLVLMSSANTSEFGASGIDLRWAASFVPVTSTASPPTEVLIYFATTEGLKAMSTDGAEISTIWTDIYKTDVRGVTYDSSTSKIYWNGYDTIYRANPDGTDVETVFNSNHYSPIYGIACDWTTGNLFGGRANSIGEIFVCSTVGGTLSCGTIVSGYRAYSGIAVDPWEGKIYWNTRTETTTYAIMRSAMDGSDVEIVIEAPFDTFDPTAIAIDFRSGQLYWTNNYGNKIETSNLQGGDRRTVTQLPNNEQPYGIAVMGIDRVYWGTQGQYSIKSSTKAGEDIRTLHSSKVRINHLALGTREITPTGRDNHCKGSGCSHICVLTLKSFRCLCPYNMRLHSDQLTCVQSYPSITN